MAAPKQTAAPAAGTWRIYAAGLAACTALALASYLLVVRPSAQRHQDQQARQSQLRAARQKAAGLVGTLNNTRNQLQAVKESLASLSLRLEPASAVNQRLSHLTELANASGLTIDEMRPGAPADGADYQTVPVLIAGNGTYPACARFFHRLHETFPDMSVRSFQTANNSASADSPAATFQFDLAWYAAKG